MTNVFSSTDHDLKSAITEELHWTPNVNADHVGIGVTDGAVTLSGQVADYPAKQAAISAALRVHGVAAVADEIVVEHAMGRRPDADIARNAADALAATVVVPADSVTATVHDHVVTLTGAVGWEYQRHAAQHAVASLKAVRAVVNHIMLEPPIVISPVDARTNIARALVRNARLDATNIDVAIDGTQIRLTGKVTSWAERHQAEYAGWSTPGVTHVDNQLRIVGSA
jgi:osmotically-inducible protein OsmY